MKRILIFGIIVSAAIALLAIVLAWYLYVYQAGMAGLARTMSQMMGNQYPSTQMMPSYVFTTLIALIVFILVGVVGFVYYIAYPQIIRTATTPSSQFDPRNEELVPLAQHPESHKESWDALLRTSKPDERKVLEMLSAHGGKHLQKLVVKESGLSKLRTHRIISRFSERGIVSVSKSGNTNEISLSPWLLKEPEQNGSESSSHRMATGTHK